MYICVCIHVYNNNKRACSDAGSGVSKSTIFGGDTRVFRARRKMRKQVDEVETLTVTIRCRVYDLRTVRTDEHVLPVPLHARKCRLFEMVLVFLSFRTFWWSAVTRTEAARPFNPLYAIRNSDPSPARRTCPLGKRNFHTYRFIGCRKLRPIFGNEREIRLNFFFFLGGGKSDGGF